MNDIMSVKCPWCTAVLKIKYVPGIEGKKIKCPVCGQTSPFPDFTVVDGAALLKPNPNPVQRPTPKPVGGEATQIAGAGALVDTATGMRYPLKEGRNIVGRKAVGSQADVSIDTRGMMRMSRKHLLIDVKRKPNGQYAYQVSLAQSLVNPTSVNKQLLQYGDVVYITDGATLDLPDCTLRFTAGTAAGGGETEYGYDSDKTRTL